jgi:hypothetical protein
MAIGLSVADKRRRDMEDLRVDMSIMDTFDDKMDRLMTRINRSYLNSSLDLDAIDRESRRQTRQRRADIREEIREIMQYDGKQVADENGDDDGPNGDAYQSNY